MRKLFISILAITFVIMFSTFSFAVSESACGTMWQYVSGRTFTLTIDEVVYKANFSSGTHGPCPTGTLELYTPDVEIPDCYVEGNENAVCYTSGELIGTCEYKCSHSFIYVSCDNWLNTLTFIFCKDKNILVLIDPNILMLQIVPEEE